MGDSASEFLVSRKGLWVKGGILLTTLDDFYNFPEYKKMRYKATNDTNTKETKIHCYIVVTFFFSLLTFI